MVPVVQRTRTRPSIAAKNEIATQTGRLSAIE
jgi:hypothetical protein